MRLRHRSATTVTYGQLCLAHVIAMCCCVCLVAVPTVTAQGNSTNSTDDGNDTMTTTMDMSGENSTAVSDSPSTAAPSPTPMDNASADVTTVTCPTISATTTTAGGGGGGGSSGTFLCGDDTPTWLLLGICSGGGFLLGAIIVGFIVYGCVALPAKRKLGRLYLDRGGAQSFMNPAAVDDLKMQPQAAPRGSRGTSCYYQDDVGQSFVSSGEAQNGVQQRRLSPAVNVPQDITFRYSGASQNGQPVPHPRGEIRSLQPRLSSQGSEDASYLLNPHQQPSQGQPRRFSKQLIEERREQRHTQISLTEMTGSPQ